MFHTDLCLWSQCKDGEQRALRTSGLWFPRLAGSWVSGDTVSLVSSPAWYQPTPFLDWNLDWTKAEGTQLFCFLHKLSSSIPNCHFCCCISYLDFIFCWSKKYQLHALLCSDKVSARHRHSSQFPLELKFCAPKMPYKTRGDTQKQHQKSRVSEMLPVGSFLCSCLWGFIEFLEWSKKEL